MSEFKVKTSLREVDCTKYEPIVKHPYVTRLNNISQLSYVDKIYRGAKHSRLDHSIFVYHFTDEIGKHLVKKGCIDGYEKTNSEIASMLHDIGHGPKAHAFEFVSEELEKLKGKKYNHKIKAVKLIDSEKKDRDGRTLGKCIEECGGDVELVKELILKKNPLCQIRSHNTLGADKTGFMLLDSNRTFYYTAFPFLLDIFPKYFFDGENLGLEDEEKIPQIKVLQAAYQDMYINVYFHPRVRFYERLFERAIQEVVENNIASTEKLWGLEEFEVENLLKNNERTSKLFAKIENEEMDEKVVSISYDPENEKEFKNLVNFYSNPLNLTKAEKMIAEEFNCKNHQIICNLRVIPERIIPEDVYIFSLDKSIFEIRPTFYQSLVEEANLHTSINLFKEPKVKLNERRCKEILTNEIPKIR